MKFKFLSLFFLFIFCLNFMYGKERQRIISLSPAGTEIIFALEEGESLIGRTDFCDYPPEAQSVPSVGGFDGKTISLEKIIAMKPTGVFLTDGMHNHLELPLRELGIETCLLKGSSIEDIYQGIISVSTLLKVPEKGETLVEKIKAQVNSVSVNKATSRPKVYYEISSNPYITCGEGSFLNEVIKAAGGINCFEDSGSPYPDISPEAIILANPDVIIYPIYSEKQNPEKILAEIISRPGWNLINAVKNGRIIFIDCNLAERTGPRIGEGILLLNSGLYEN